MAWHTVAITKVTNVVTWVMDGITIATVTNDVAPFSTNIFVGYQDIFASGVISDNPAMSYGLVDNLIVETFVSSPIKVSNIKAVGSNIEITFTAGTDAVASDFKLQTSATVNGTF